MAIQGMSTRDLVSAAEARLGDAERNLASCADSMMIHKQKHGGVPNVEVIALAQAQATVAQAFASVALAKTTVAWVDTAETSTISVGE